MSFIGPRRSTRSTKGAPARRLQTGKSSKPTRTLNHNTSSDENLEQNSTVIPVKSNTLTTAQDQQNEIAILRQQFANLQQQNEDAKREKEHLERELAALRINASESQHTSQTGFAGFSSQLTNDSRSHFESSSNETIRPQQTPASQVNMTNLRSSTPIQSYTGATQYTTMQQGNMCMQSGQTTYEVPTSRPMINALAHVESSMPSNIFQPINTEHAHVHANPYAGAASIPTIASQPIMSVGPTPIGSHYGHAYGSAPSNTNSGHQQYASYSHITSNLPQQPFLSHNPDGARPTMSQPFMSDPFIHRQFPLPQYVHQSPAYMQPQPMDLRFNNDNRRTHDLPKFSGRPEEWFLFVNSYTMTTQQFGYSDTENMLRLLKCLTGDAKKRVESVLVRPEHVGRTMAMLEKAFGNPEMLVESQINLARSMPKIEEDNPKQLMDFSLVVDGVVAYLECEATQYHLYNTYLLNELECKLPMSERKSWAKQKMTIRHRTSIRDFARWLDEEANVMSTIRSYTSTHESSTPGRTRQARTNVNKQVTSDKGADKFVLLNVATENPKKATTKCAFCAEDHHIRQCISFLRLSVQSRLNEIKKNPICYGCLSDGHILPGCDNRKKCGVDGCERWHDPLLHEEKSVPNESKMIRSHQRGGRRGRTNQTDSTVASCSMPTNPESNSSTSATSGYSSTRSTVLNCRTGQSEKLLLFRVLPVVLYGPKRTVQTYALLDEGSSVSLIDDALANELGLEGVETDLDLQFANAQGTIQASREVRFGISGAQSDAQRFEIHSVYATSALTLPTQTVSRSAIVDNNAHLRDVPFAEYQAARPRLLIGLDHHHLGISLQTRTSAMADGIMAAMTKLGWVLFGSDGQAALPSAVVLHVRHQDGDDERWTQLNELVRTHFTTENFGCKLPTAVIESDGLTRARNILASTTKRVGERFETGLLWARDDVELPDSYAMAMRRLSGVESKMKRDVKYAEQYRSQVQAYIDKGYARKATAEEAAQRGGRSWFLPHFAVQSISKPGKFRLVFDAAATTSNVSLNQALLSGPDINVPLTRLLFRFRLGSVGVCADVKEMYHQVLIRHEDRKAQRFLWRYGDTTKSPEVFIMNVMTFGSTCSPASAQHVKNTNAAEFKDEFPEAFDAICNNHYVDDYVASFATSDDAIRITSDVIDIQKRGGFDLRGVISNSAEVQRQFGLESAKQTVELEPEGVLQKILGMTWETNDDRFCFKTNFGRVRPGIMEGTQRPTKRDVLSVTMSIFDPFGLLADFLLASKVVLQELWRADVGWDDLIPDPINANWQAWRVLVERTRLVRIPRCYSPSILSAPGLQLHVFADASEEAFAAVAYWRIQGAEGVELAFVAGKVRCAPMKILSIPRMELQAAMLATRLMVEIRESHAELHIDETILWSDSETVLKWLRCDQRRYKVFVAIRVAEVVENAPAKMWRWVPSALNPADDATRVKTPLTFEPESRWLCGPSWLIEAEENWPTKPNSIATDEARDDDEEVRARFIGAISQRGAVEFIRFSKYNRLIRAIAWAKRFVSNARGPRAQRVTGELSSNEFDRALVTVCLMVQMDAFADELELLRDGKQLDTKSKIFALKPYVDDDGLLRVHGRTDAADERFISSAAKRPIILSHDHRVTMLIVRHHHEQFAHQLTDATIAAVRAKFWIPQLRTLVNQVRHSCQTCKMRTATPAPTVQGQLPRDRMDAYARPFTNTGLDFFGPVLVTVGRRHEKRWVALFTCLTVRAVHLEIASDLSTDACLICIKNLCNIRGVPSLIRCDNGTNFVGARNEIDREPAFFDTDAVQRELSIKGIKWRFNCPGNPEAGGAWERLVQSVKRVLHVTLHESAPKTETLRSLLIEAANIVNARPLTHLQVTPDDPEPLTPNHFLLGGPNVATMPNPEDTEPTATRKQWKICRGLSRVFWQQFVRDYLPELTRRGKHYPEQQPLQVGDLVIVCDEQQPRSRWSRARVIEVTMAPDGIVRTAVVQTASGKCRRPATKLARLDVCASDGIDVRGAECRQLVSQV